MDAMLHRHCARYIYIVPDGLRELMSDISREVIRSQPEAIYTFIADYLDALMITRENARVAARLVQSITEISENIIDLLLQTGISRDNAERIANIMQAAFKKYIDVRIGQKSDDVTEEEVIQEILENTGLTMDEANNAALVIQQAYRKFKEKKDREKELLTGMIDWRVAARSAIQLYRKTGVTEEEAHRAATMIKAAYKGYYTRRFMKKLSQEAAHIFDAEESDSEDQYQETVAFRIGQDSTSGLLLEEDEERSADEEQTEQVEEDENEQTEEEKEKEAITQEIRYIMDEVLDKVVTNLRKKSKTSVHIMEKVASHEKDPNVMEILEVLHTLSDENVIKAASMVRLGSIAEIKKNLSGNIQESPEPKQD